VTHGDSLTTYRLIDADRNLSLHLASYVHSLGCHSLRVDRLGRHSLLLCCQCLLLLLASDAAAHGLLPVARIQIFIDLEPVELQLVPQLLILLVHDIRNAVVLLLLLLDIFVLLLLLVCVRFLVVPIPKIA